MNKGAAEQSLVNIVRNGENLGMGVFAPNRRVVTARHCINHALETASRIVRVSKFMDPNVAVDMVVEWYDENFEIDIAILKPLDPNTIHEFEKHLQPAPIQFSLPAPPHELFVHLYRHDAGWATGKTQLLLPDPLLMQEQQMGEIISDPGIAVHRGTSGSPVFDDTGAVIGVTMMSGADAEAYGVVASVGTGGHPVFALFAPVLSVMMRIVGQPQPLVPATPHSTYSHTQKGPLGLILGFSSLIFFIVAWLVLEGSVLPFVLFGIGVLMIVLATAFHHLTIEDQDDRLAIRFGPLPLFRRTVKYADMGKAEVGRTLILDGWGIHYSIRGGWVWNLWGRECVVLHFKNGHVLRIGTDDAENLARFLEGKIVSTR